MNFIMWQVDENGCFCVSDHMLSPVCMENLPLAFHTEYFQNKSNVHVSAAKGLVQADLSTHLNTGGAFGTCKRELVQC